jgi:hypothetical protein
VFLSDMDGLFGPARTSTCISIPSPSCSLFIPGTRTTHLDSSRCAVRSLSGRT